MLIKIPNKILNYATNIMKNKFKTENKKFLTLAFIFLVIYRKL